jgi:TetR/AcrR family transcriptional regulator
MSELLPIPEPVTTADVGDSPVARKRPKPGERRMQILQTLAEMLEQPGAERITTAALAARLSVSEAALYRHFASKAQMFEGLIDFIEQAVFTRVTQIVGRDPADAAQPAEGGAHQAARVVALLLQFGERNPGLVRVMVGEALVLEHERLQQRMNQFFERIESSLRQCPRARSSRRGKLLHSHGGRPGSRHARRPLRRAGCSATPFGFSAIANRISGR